MTHSTFSCFAEFSRAKVTSTCISTKTGFTDTNPNPPPRKFPLNPRPEIPLMLQYMTIRRMLDHVGMCCHVPSFPELPRAWCQTSKACSRGLNVYPRLHDATSTGTLPDQVLCVLALEGLKAWRGRGEWVPVCTGPVADADFHEMH